jgi:hypothetical protein
MVGTHRKPQCQTRLEGPLLQAIKPQQERRLADEGQLGLGNAIASCQRITDQLTGKQTNHQGIKLWTQEFQQDAGP